jgi:Xaa-Pro aminopeptidase
MRFSRSGIRLKPMAAVIETLRAVKDMEEITLITEAIRRAEGAFLDIKPYIKSGRSEAEIASRLEDRLKKRGCKKIAFDIIVASGNNSALPHARASDRRLSPGDLVVLDWGGEAEGYFSDMTRTLLVKAENISKQKELYNTVLEANRAAISAAANNGCSRDIDKAARDLIKKAGYGEFFGHGTGHGVGLEVHELPHITWTKNGILRQNMVFTIEPGIYMPGFGGVRIEDMLLLKEKGCKTLTTLPKKLEII